MEKFKCVICGETFYNGQSEEEAEAELKRNFGDIDKKDCEVACSECYKKFMERYKNDKNNN